MAIDETTVRANILSFANWCVARKEWFEYDEIRPYPLYIPTADKHIKNDCSGTVTWCYYHAGAPDPNGLDYDGSGYTGTLIDHGTQVNVPQVGDLVIYGNNPGVHTAVIVVAEEDPVTMSHGQASEPAFVKVSEGNPTSVPPRYFTYPLLKPVVVASMSSANSPPSGTKFVQTANFQVQRYGDNNNYVKIVQGLLVAHGIPCPISGRFDTATRNAVIRFQALNQIQEHVYVGEMTLMKLLQPSNTV